MLILCRKQIPKNSSDRVLDLLHGRIPLLTAITNFSRDSLRERRMKHRRNKKWLRTKVYKTRYCGWRIVGVKSWENKMSCESCLNCKLRRFFIANLTDKNYVWILSQKWSEPACECKSRLNIHLNLINPWHLVLDRILERCNVDAGLVKSWQDRVKSGCLSRSRWSSNQYDSVRFVDRGFHVPQLRASKT